MPDDIRLLLSFKGHHKRKKLKRKLGEGYLDYLLDLWLSVASIRPDGYLHGWNHEDIADYAGWDNNADIFVKALVDTGWLDVYSTANEDQLYKCHDWEIHQPWVIGATERSEKARLAALIKNHGEKKGRQLYDGLKTPVKPEHVQVACGEHAGSTCGEHAPSPLPLPSPLPKDDSELPSSLVDEKSSTPLCHHKEIISLYHKILPAHRKVQVWQGQREKMLRARWNEDPKRQDLKWWENYFHRVRQSDFLTGKTDKPFLPDLEWLIRPNNICKVIEGKYDNSGMRLDEETEVDRKLKKWREQNART